MALETRLLPPAAVDTQVLPFSVFVAQTSDELDELVRVRAAAYLRHNAPAASRLSRSEEQDRNNDAILLVARSKLTGSVVGSVRVQTRLRKPLSVESALTLPDEMLERSPVELMRGNVLNGVGGKMVSAALAKGSYQVCKALKFSHIIVTCREPVDLMYRAYQFDDLLNGAMVDLPYSPGVKHKVLTLNVQEAEQRWKTNNPPLLNFMVGTNHPDIAIDYDYIFRRLNS